MDAAPDLSSEVETDSLPDMPAQAHYKSRSWNHGAHGCAVILQNARNLATLGCVLP